MLKNIGKKHGDFPHHGSSDRIPAVPVGQLAATRLGAKECLTDGEFTFSRSWGRTTTSNPWII